MTATSQTARYQIRKREDGRFAVVQFTLGKIEPVLRAVAETHKAAKDFIAIEVAKQAA